MKPSIIHRIVVCLAAFTLPFMVACSSQEDSLSEAGSSLWAVFTLDLGDTVACGMTRATPTDGEYDKGSGLENFIDFPKKDFRCYLFGMDNVFVSTLDIVSIQDFGEKIYSIRLRLPDTEMVKNALTNGCRFVFLANWGSYDEPIPGTTTIADLCTASSAQFEFSQQKTVLSADNLIPMYGVKEFESGVQDFKDGKDISDIGTVHLLRAFAKVDVNIKFEDFAEEPVVTSVSLTRSNDKGFKAPKDVTEEGQYVHGSWHKDYTHVHIPDDAGDIEDLMLTKDETGHYIAYVPEYRNVNGQKEPLDSRSRIKIGFTIGNVTVGGLHVEQEFDFRYSDENPPEGVTAGQHFDIARNNWYKFNITAKGKDMVWTVDVIPFTPVELTPDYGLVREEFTGYIVGKDGQKRDCWYDGNYYDPAKAVPLYLGPTGQEGKAVAINGGQYILVYANYERTAAMLDHIIDKETGKKYLLYPAGRTGYENVNWTYYLNDLKHPVWLDEDYNEWNVVWNAEKGKDEWVYTPGKWYRTLNEWDRLDWNRAVYDHEVQDPGIYPRFWFDVLGNRYLWSEGDTKEKRADILGEWVKYLE